MVRLTAMRWPALLVLSLLAVLRGAAAATEYHGRGVYYFDGPVRSPLAGIGSRGDYATNRIALDDDRTTVSVDPAAQRIVFSNSASQPSAAVIGDLVLFGLGTNARGQDVPVAVHLVIEKHHAAFTAQVHPHPTTREKLTNLRFAPYTVVTRGGAGETTVLTPAQARKAIEEPELAARLAKLFMQVTDHLEGQAVRPEHPDARLVDVSFGFGVRKLKLNVCRVELVSVDPTNAALIHQGSFADMLAKGSWEFRITSQTWLPPEEFTRDLFLFGLDGIPFLQILPRHGLPRGESLVVGFNGGTGYVRLGTQRAAIANPADVARAYMEFHFVGGIIAQQVATLPQRLPAPAAP